MLKGDEVETYTGFPIGGVCPFAPKDGVKVYLDISLNDLIPFIQPVVAETVP